MQGTTEYGCGSDDPRQEGRRPKSDQREQSSQPGSHCSCGLERRLHHPLQQHACEKNSTTRSKGDCQGTRCDTFVSGEWYVHRVLSRMGAHEAIKNCVRYIQNNRRGPSDLSNEVSPTASVREAHSCTLRKSVRCIQNNSRRPSALSNGVTPTASVREAHSCLPAQCLKLKLQIMPSEDEIVDDGIDDETC